LRLVATAEDLFAPSPQDCGTALRLFTIHHQPLSTLRIDQISTITLNLHIFLTPNQTKPSSTHSPRAAKMTAVMNPSTTTPSLSHESNTTSDSVNDENNAPVTSSPATTASGNNVTVFHDPENFNVKHPLQNQWTLWFTKPSTGKIDNWNDLLKEVVTFDSVEEFWGVYV
jgi:Eukaryotic initiation factor 4E